MADSKPKLLNDDDITVCEWNCEDCEQHFVTNAEAVMGEIGADPYCPYCGSREVDIPW